MNSLISKFTFFLLAMLAWSACDAKAFTLPTGHYCNPASGFNNPLPADMCFQLNVAYGSDPLQKFDVYMPSKGASKAPVIVMVHGGAWYQGDKFDNSVVRNKADYWVRKGTILISINYRLVPNVDPLQQAGDVARALGYAQQHVAEWGGDPDKLVLMGFSAGGHLVSLLASDPSLATTASPGLRPWLGTIALDAAVYDVPLTMGNPNHDPIFDQAFGTDPALWNAASPIVQLDARPAPFLAVCSTVESGSCTRAQAFVDDALGYGADALVLQEALDHEHINANLGLASDYTTQVNAFIAGLLNGTLH
ncbi:alpha/beta hydrolase [Pseudoluteimonas lycopersici]|nr:alpha/beta hydrolase [Lysobacter lycopersici]